MFIKPPQIIRFFFPSIVWKKENTQNNIWLTFDDGPCPQVTPFILNTLREEDVKATFFLIGEQIDKYPALYKQIMEAGHMIGNHSYSHKNSWTSNSSNYLNDIEILSEKSGNRVFDWTIPREWKVNEAYILDPEGKKLCNF